MDENQPLGWSNSVWVDFGKLVYTRVPGGFIITSIVEWSDSLGAQHKAVSSTFVRFQDAFPKSSVEP